MNRRNFIAAAAAAAGGAAWYGYDGEALHGGGDGPYSAWKEWDAAGASAPEGLLRSAVLASSPHNTQPWRFRVAGSSLAAGRLWQRAHLLATVRGVAARPCNEAIEMIDYERRHGRPGRRLRQLAGVTGDPEWQPTFLFLMGMPTLRAHLSPRRGVRKAVLS